MVTEARSAVMGAKTVKQAAEAEKEMTGVLGRLFAIAEAYPELKANANFVIMMKLNGHNDVTFYELDGFGHSDMAKPAHTLLLKYIKIHHITF